MNGFEQYLVYKVKQFKNESESWVLGADCMRETRSHLVQVWIFFFVDYMTKKCTRSVNELKADQE